METTRYAIRGPEGYVGVTPSRRWRDTNLKTSAEYCRLFTRRGDAERAAGPGFTVVPVTLRFPD